MSFGRTAPNGACEALELTEMEKPEAGGLKFHEISGGRIEQESVFD